MLNLGGKEHYSAISHFKNYIKIQAKEIRDGYPCCQRINNHNGEKKELLAMIKPLYVPHSLLGTS